MKLHESGENYLEAILVLLQKSPNVHSIDVANHLGFSKPSISRAMGILKRERYIDIDGEGHISLTKKGREKAESVYERHELLAEYLMDLGVCEEIAIQDACRIEHVISDETFEKIKEHVKAEKINNSF